MQKDFSGIAVGKAEGALGARAVTERRERGKAQAWRGPLNSVPVTQLGAHWGEALTASWLNVGRSM